ncbi:MAG: hypothetical protein ACKO9F_06155, partial [Caldilinea sp.]
MAVEDIRLKPVGGGGRKALQKRGGDAVVVGLEAGQRRRARRQATVVGAELLADVAAEDAIAKAGAQLARDDRARLDGPVGAAA